MEKLALSLNVSVGALEKALDVMCIDITDYEASPEDYLPALRSQLGLPGELAVSVPSPLPVKNSSPELPASGGAVVATKKGKVTKTKATKTAQEKAQATQVAVDQKIDSTMDVAIANVREMNRGIESFTDEVAAYTAGAILAIPETIASKTASILGEAGETASTGFHSFSARSDAKLEALR